MRTEDFNYHLPEDRIAQTPIEPRHNSKLMIYDRETGTIKHEIFHQIGSYLKPGDLLVVNQTRVIPARIFAQKQTGGKVEILLLRNESGNIWECLVGGKRVTAGKRLEIENGPTIRVLKNLEGSKRLIEFESGVEPYLEKIGQMPLPPYIHTPLRDPERYQTVYAKRIGSAAAPTAGLHFTPSLISDLREQGIGFCEVTLHVGLDTFAPVTEDDPREHKIHTEWCELSQENADMINWTAANGGRIIAVGTTSVRTLETAAQHAPDGKKVGPTIGPTSLFILPGYEFKVVDAMITNYHLPRSTLLMLVSAFAGRENILKLYETALENHYRFYSFGDAMFLK